MLDSRIQHAALRQRVADAAHAATLIWPGETVAMSGFTGSGYPKAVPQALAAHIGACLLYTSTNTQQTKTANDD